MAACASDLSNDGDMGILISPPPPPPPPPPPAVGCTSFPATLLGARSSSAYAILMPGPWLSAPLGSGEFEELAVLADRFSSGGDSLRFDHRVIAEFAAATGQILRSGLPIKDLAERQQLSFRQANERLRTALSAPNGVSVRGDPNDRDAWSDLMMITWLIAFKAAQADRTGGALEAFLSQVEPLSQAVGISLSDALRYFTDRTRPDYNPHTFEAWYGFAFDTLERPGGLYSEMRVTRALAYTLDNLRNRQLEQNSLFSELDRGLKNYFASRPGVGSSRSSTIVPEPGSEPMSNAFFLWAVERYRSGASIPAQGEDPCLQSGY